MLSEECNFCLEKNTPHFFHQQGQSLYSTLSMCLISSASESTTGTSGQVKILKYCFIRWCMSASFCACVSFRPEARAWYRCLQIHLLRAHIMAVVVPKCCKIFCYDNNYASPRFWNISSSCPQLFNGSLFSGNDHMVVVYHHQFSVQVWLAATHTWLKEMEIYSTFTRMLVEWAL